MDAKDELRAERKEQIKLAISLLDDCVDSILQEVFKDAISGDFPPDATFDWEHAKEQFFYRWCYWNLPEMQDDSA